MKRREFLIGAAAVTGIAGTTRTWAQSRDRAKLDRIAIMSLCFNSILKMPGRPSDSSGTLTLDELPEMYADRYGVHNIELQHSHLLSTEDAYLKDFRARVEKVKSRISQINLEFGDLNISAEGHSARLQAVDLTKRWIDHAVLLGCPIVMVNQGRPTEENKQDAITALKAMGDYGKSKSVKVAMEPRGGGRARDAAPAAPTAAPPPAPWILLAEIIKASGTYATPDIGNFGDDETTHAGIRGLLPMASGNCHVKLRPERFDLVKALRLLEELGYDGLYSNEANKSVSPDPYEAVQTVHDIVLDNI
jgi:hypothetical protein